MVVLLLFLVYPPGKLLRDTAPLKYASARQVSLTLRQVKLGRDLPRREVV